MAVTRLPYGSWASPITAELIVADTVGFGGLWFDGADLYWTELRSTEAGRYAVVRLHRSACEDVVSAPYSARTRVNEYGGGALAVTDGVVYFSNDADQRVYRAAPGSAPVAITPADARRYADFVVDRARRRLIAVCEDHTAVGEPPQSLVAIDLQGASAPRTLARGRDFYAAPRLSPDGKRLAFLAWDHPNMPWDATELCVATFDAAGDVAQWHVAAGGAAESVCQPLFAPDGALYYISDATGWWNLYRQGEPDPVLRMAAEFAGPSWVFGLSSYAFAGRDRLVGAFSRGGTWGLGVFDLTRRAWRQLAVPYTDIGYVRADARRAMFIGAGPRGLPEIVEFDLATEGTTVLRRSARVSIDAGFLATPQAIDFPTGQEERAHAFFYPPQHPEVAGPVAARPPLLVVSHGGPTAASTNALNLKIQYWTSRGFAVLDVNYRGSSGFGRAYRRRLEGEWGVVDVEDCVNGARWLAARGDVDAARLAIRGSSAGGYTVLCALAFHDTFRAGASYYGISDLELLVRDTHKFESRYLDRLVGPYPAERERYRARSPIHYVERIDCPLIFFQGLEDRVVPPNQTERLVAALRARGVPVAYLAFPGEQHGFRVATNVMRALETELRFYGRVFGFATDVDARLGDPLAEP